MERLIDSNTKASVKYSTCSHRTTDCLSIKDFETSFIRDEIICELISGIIVLTDKKQIVYSNLYGKRILKQLNQSTDDSIQIPPEFCHICQSLINIRELFPNQFWSTQFDIFIENLANLHINARWLTVDKLEQPYLLLLIEDRKNTINKIVSQEAEQYGLTPRESEVWLLHRRGQTYKQIAFELNITPNTVKKHMKSIHSKRKKVMVLNDLD